VKPSCGKPGGESRQGQPRTGYLIVGHGLVEPEIAGKDFELQRRAARFQEFAKA
jgi:hypothetical protein